MQDIFRGIDWTAGYNPETLTEALGPNLTYTGKRDPESYYKDGRELFFEMGDDEVTAMRGWLDIFMEEGMHFDYQESESIEAIFNDALKDDHLCRKLALIILKGLDLTTHASWISLYTIGELWSEGDVITYAYDIFGILYDFLRKHRYIGVAG